MVLSPHPGAAATFRYEWRGRVSNWTRLSSETKTRVRNVVGATSGSQLGDSKGSEGEVR